MNHNLADHALLVHDLAEHMLQAPANHLVRKEEQHMQPRIASKLPVCS